MSGQKTSTTDKTSSHTLRQWLAAAFLLSAMGCDTGNVCFSHKDCAANQRCDDGICVNAISDSEILDLWHAKPNRGEIHDPGTYVFSSAIDGDGRFPLVNINGEAAPLWMDPKDHAGVQRAAADLKKDISLVTEGAETSIYTNATPPGDHPVIIGTIGKSALIDGLIDERKLDVSELQDKWETFIITQVSAPFPGVDKALVIVGSDQRGTIYGIYDLSAQIGVSPWHYWADVPVAPKTALYIAPGVHTQGEPAVKYRGFFINAEYPALTTWVEQSDEFDRESRLGSVFYEHIFELMLRLKANLLWPAVWGRSFAQEDPDNYVKANEYGIIIGTSHEAAMLRDIEEWKNIWSEDRGNGDYDFKTNRNAVERFWQQGITRMVEKPFEGMATLGMRGVGNEAIKDGITPEDMLDIFDTQRRIIADITEQGAAETPQVWTLYNEVLDWWNKDDIRPPDDVTVIWCDDNFGNFRKLPHPTDDERAGGHGLYYHLEAVGAPRNYKWVDTNLLPNIWEQLHLAYAHGVDRLWMINAGDVKTHELPIQFFMDYAWNPERWAPSAELKESESAHTLFDWERAFAKQQFGMAGNRHTYIADLLRDYAALQSDRKPEMLNMTPESNEACPFSLTNYQEMARVVEAWKALAGRADDIAMRLDDDYKDAYFELISYRINATALLYETRLTGFQNRFYAAQNRASAKTEEKTAYKRFRQSRDLADTYNENIGGGKWRGFQTQPYFGYGGDYPNSEWQQPEANGRVMEDFIYPPLLEAETVTNGPLMGLAVDGSTAVYPSKNTSHIPTLPVFSPYQTHPPQFIDVFMFNQKAKSLDFEITTDADWLDISPNKGRLDENTPQVRANFTVPDWSIIPYDEGEALIEIRNTADPEPVYVRAVFHNPPSPPPPNDVYVEANGYVSMEADRYNINHVSGDGLGWKRIPGIGRTGAGMTLFPVTADRIIPGDDTPRLDYDMYLFSKGEVTIHVYLSPRMNIGDSDGLTFGLSVDDGDIEYINTTERLGISSVDFEASGGWREGVMNNVHHVSETFTIDSPGRHTVKLWAVDPTLIVQKLVIATDELPPSYFGPPESFYLPAKELDENFENWDEETADFKMTIAEDILENNGSVKTQVGDHRYSLMIHAVTPGNQGIGNMIGFTLALDKEADLTQTSYDIRFDIYVPKETFDQADTGLKVNYAVSKLSTGSTKTYAFSDASPLADQWKTFSTTLSLADADSVMRFDHLHIRLLDSDRSNGPKNKEFLFYVDNIVVEKHVEDTTSSIPANASN